MNAVAGQPRHWCIVGGGMLGLTLAARLSQQQERVTVMEAAATLGGLAEPWQIGPVTWDRHYHVILLSDDKLRRLLAEFELEADIRWRITRTGFYADGVLYPLNNAMDYLRLPVMSWVGKVRLAATLFYVSRIADGRRLESLTVGEWLTRLSGRRVFESVWRPLLRAKLGDNYKKTSAAFIWAVIRRLYAARQGHMKREMFGYLPGGYARVLQRMAAVLASRGVDIRLSCPTRRIERRDGGLIVETPDGQQRFDKVIVTAAAPIAAQICHGLSDDEQRRLLGIVYQGVICVSLLLSRRLSGNYLTYITDSAIPFTAVIEMTGLVDPAELMGNTLIFLPRYVTQDDPMLAWSDDDIVAAFRTALRSMYPALRDEEITHARVSRVRQVLAVSTLDYSAHLPPMITSVTGLAIVNSAHIVNGTLNVNETVALAETALPRLLAEACKEPVMAAADVNVPEKRVSA